VIRRTHPDGPSDALRGVDGARPSEADGGGFPTLASFRRQCKAQGCTQAAREASSPPHGPSELFNVDWEAALIEIDGVGLR
jgi:ABC-type transporter Mla MlaB component